MSSDATAVLKQKQPAGKSQSWTKAAMAWAGIALIMALSLLVFIIWIVGITHGREFDAGSWTFRSFTFLRNPITGNQLTALRHKADFTIDPSITALIGGGPLAPGTRWDLVEMYKGPVHSVGQAQILLDYLSAFNQQNMYYWTAWTSKNSQAAPILWSAVRDCVHLPRYDRLPEIFEMARSTTDPPKLKAELNRIMLDIANDEIQLQTTLGNEEAKKRAEKLKTVYLDETEPTSTDGDGQKN